MSLWDVEIDFLWHTQRHMNTHKTKQQKANQHIVCVVKKWFDSNWWKLHFLKISPRITHPPNNNDQQHPAPPWGTYRDVTVESHARSSNENCRYSNSWKSWLPPWASRWMDITGRLGGGLSSCLPFGVTCLKGCVCIYFYCIHLRIQIYLHIYIYQPYLKQNSINWRLKLFEVWQQQLWKSNPSKQKGSRLVSSNPSFLSGNVCNVFCGVKLKTVTGWVCFFGETMFDERTSFRFFFPERTISYTSNRTWRLWFHNKEMWKEQLVPSCSFGIYHVQLPIENLMIP